MNRLASPEAVLVSNTSSLSISEMADVSGRPGNFAGLHFFFPAAINRLLEVIAGRETSPEVMDLLMEGTGLERDRLWDAYIEFIKRIPGPQLFSDGRTSYEYRKERFTQILKSFDIDDEELAEGCVEIYSKQLLADMKPFPDTMDVL